MYEYMAKVDRVIDGDTISLNIDLGLSTWAMGERVRLDGLDCPEMDTPAGVLAKSATEEWLSHRSNLTVQTIKDRKEKYGRLLAVVFPFGTTDRLESLNCYLLQNGFAAVYDGGAR